jgi:hypothetical protein
MASVRKEVTGVAAALANSYEMNPQGGTDMGPGASGDATGKKYLEDAPGLIDNNAVADTKDYGLTKGPQRTSLGATGTSMSGNGKGRFGGKVIPDQN